jgi:uncharacterized protein HemY
MAARICCLRPGGDEQRLEYVLELARKALETAKTDWMRRYLRVTLGMAEYRNGHFAKAEATLAAGIEQAKTEGRMGGLPSFYLAMSLFQQGKTDEARRLATEAAAKMKPLPKDEKNPLADGATSDDLILWMAYKEARALIQFDPPPIPPPQPDKK